MTMERAVSDVLTKGGARITGINGTTRDRIMGIVRQTVTEGMADGVSMARMGDMLEDALGDAATFGEYRSELIARTETMMAYNRAALTTYGEYGIGRVQAIDGDTDDSRIEGRVVVEAGAKVVGSVVRGPVVIGAGARIEDAYVGPYTSIGEDVHIRRSEVEHSIVLAGSVVEDLGTRMEASLLGRNVKLTRSDGMPKTLRLLVGDNCDIEIV